MPTGTAVVAGAGLAGMLAASVLARRVGRVTLVERDALPSGPRPRRGVPQARHAHLLMSGGVRALDALLPGTSDRLEAAGARRVGMPGGVVSMSAYGWQRRFPSTRHIFACSRELLDWVVGRAVLADPRITLVEGADVTGLRGGPGAVTGVRVRPRDGGPERELPADVVVNAAGRGSQLSRWLAELGAAVPEEEVIDPGTAYATRVFRAPPGAREGFPLVAIYADHREPVPGRNAVLLPIEDGRWIVTLSGTRGGEPSMAEEDFAECARRVRHPLIGTLIAGAEPLTPVYGSRSTANRRLRWADMAAWPEGLVVLGDALAAFNPVHGHGMSAAAHAAEALDRALARAPGPAGTREAQRAVAAAADDPWLLATSLDVRYPGCRVRSADPRLTRRPPEGGPEFGDLLGSAALRDPEVSAAVIDVNTLSGPLAGLQAPGVVAALRRPPAHPPLGEPPITRKELDTVTSTARRHA
ncbi:2-polyprenyl-6-methoxyphenol hydroxylase-like FAD-dependent oxidoreductase [Thermocatellispora tengchongensis]|uniref:2-polyprenyl-6-methoxyphenol hydroxylase-like FAD-dependent oxidoreductase n=1 Tax=Thermocatellispora tengchongensis TaxID=1073253 RepID=A0A840PD31_9ACTN|nr:FAD-dependent monooxygenase [Thermocatellispora tengchongensis]MBB5137518.1 2-polyprenyl-6-methoxyphenol hydroxylase-like FAD-dependent oxidoreductase [Thermocatellispora tengchongensis]